MFELRERIERSDGQSGVCDGRLTLAFEERRKSRLRARLEDGREVAVLLPRGTSLRDGDFLRDEHADITVQVTAAVEVLSVACTADHHTLARAAYHLGNRHVPVQLGDGWVAYPHDHVLDELVLALGLRVSCESRPFEPEAGGYGHSDNHHHD
jgi:urease accessory protein